MSAKLDRDALVEALASETPNVEALVTAVALVAAALAKVRKSDRRSAVVARAEGGTLMIIPGHGLHFEPSDGDGHALVLAAPPRVCEGVWDANAGVFVAVGDDGASLRWPWALVASGVSEALRGAVPAKKKPTRRPVVCPHCGKPLPP